MVEALQKHDHGSLRSAGNKADDKPDKTGEQINEQIGPHRLASYSLSSEGIDVDPVFHDAALSSLLPK